MSPQSLKSTRDFIFFTSHAIFSPQQSLLATSMISKTKIGGVILAGGKASRMNFRDKPLEPLLGKPLLNYVIAKAQPQVQGLALSVNHNIEPYQEFGLPIVRDHNRSYGGPLLGILSAMRWYRTEQPDNFISHLACFPADVPDFPSDVVSQLTSHLGEEASAVAYIHHQNQIQPLFSVWHLDLLERVEAAVAAGMYGPKLLFGSIQSVAVYCKASSPAAFCNINRMEDLKTVAQLMREKGSQID